MKVKHLVVCCLLSAALWAGLGYLAGSILFAEEGDMLANCHVYGNRQCGESAPWHGFVGK
ncbi:hypothetical protein GCM10010178_42850 [Lentzea flava]|uniref:TMhelix containing protein n=1 Tax=Lentzea flava TaxID=103732 RepID=A0ABQ2UN33_9PSEU|nr:hypothetical protein [Lentzea flava]GGU45808.1 hypothetical protein GCM10010178_42850 [Lentzea flava]